MEWLPPSRCWRADSYDLAVANAEHPDTALFGSKMAALCEGPPTFYNLDVMSTWPT